MIKHISKTAGAVVLGSAALFLTNVMLARNLSQEEYGYFSLIRTFVFLLPPLIFLGFNDALIRAEKTSSIFDVNWKRPAWNIFGAAAGICAIASIVIWFVYDLEVQDLVIIGIASLVYGRLTVTNALFRLKGFYFRGQITTAMWRFLLLFGILGMLIFSDISITKVLVVFGLVHVISFFIGIAGERTLPNGKTEIEFNSLLRSGLVYYAINILTLAMTQLDKLFISQMLSLNDLAVFTAVSLLFVTVFNLVGSSAGFVLMPHFAKGETIDRQKLIPAALLVSIAIGLVFFFCGEWFVTEIFTEKYAGYTTLIRLSILIGLVQYYQNLVQYSLGGLASDRILNQFLMVIIVSSVLMTAGFVTVIPMHGIEGAAMVTLACWLFRLIGGGILLKFSASKNVGV